jgi:hypothetical protein
MAERVVWFTRLFGWIGSNKKKKVEPREFSLVFVACGRGVQRPLARGCCHDERSHCRRRAGDPAIDGLHSDALRLVEFVLREYLLSSAHRTKRPVDLAGVHLDEATILETVGLVRININLTSPSG